MRLIEKNYNHSPLQVSLKWGKTDHSSPAAGKYDTATSIPSTPANNNPHAKCFTANSHNVHVALSGDEHQIDGVVASLTSIIAHSKKEYRRENGQSRNDQTKNGNLCLHVFVVKAEYEFIVNALKCAYNKYNRRRKNRKPGETNGKKTFTFVEDSDTPLPADGVLPPENSIVDGIEAFNFEKLDVKDVVKGMESSLPKYFLDLYDLNGVSVLFHDIPTDMVNSGV